MPVEQNLLNKTIEGLRNKFIKQKVDFESKGLKVIQTDTTILNLVISQELRMVRFNSTS